MGRDYREMKEGSHSITLILDFLKKGDKRNPFPAIIRNL